MLAVEDSITAEGNHVKEATADWKAYDSLKAEGRNLQEEKTSAILRLVT